MTVTTMRVELDGEDLGELPVRLGDDGSWEIWQEQADGTFRYWRGRRPGEVFPYYEA